MRHFKTYMVLGIVGISAVGITAANAVTPVLDASNLAQAVKQVTAWQKQYTQMVEQITQLKASYEKTKAQLDALTGSRGLGDIIDNPLVKDVVPEDVRSAYGAVTDLKQGVFTLKARTLQAEHSILDCAALGEGQVSPCELRQGLVFQDLAFEAQTLDRLKVRTAQIDGLRSQINQTQDPKAIAELQARLLVEQSHIANDKIMVDEMARLSESTRALEQQKLRERTLNRLRKDAPSAVDTFVYDPNR